MNHRPQQETKHRVAWFITPHGFGHAARAVAIMAAMRELSDIFFHIYTALPAWFFKESLGEGCTLHTCRTDIGLVQDTPLREDVQATCDQLDLFLPLDPQWVDSLAAEIRRHGCDLVVCDIAPLGIAVARAAGIPSVLVENFTWDWIYKGYANKNPCLLPHIQTLGQLFAGADYHIQTQPVCNPVPCNLTTAPVSRKIRTTGREVREKLNPDAAPMILITMGGISSTCSFLDRLRQENRYVFLLPGSADSLVFDGNLRLFPFRSGFYHPDLIAASDAVVGKVGYSTVAEVYQADVPFGFIPRSDFRESIALCQFIRERMNGIEISDHRFVTGDWLDILPELVSMQGTGASRENGAPRCALFLNGLITTGENDNGRS